MRTQLLVCLPVLAVACTFPDVDTTGLGGGSTTSTSTSPDTTTTTGDPTTTSSTSTGDGGAPATTSSAGGTSSDGGGGGSTGSVGGGGASSTQTTGSAGGAGGSDPCPEGCALTYGWKADGCTAYDVGACPDFTYEGSDAPSCGDSTSLRQCEPRGIVIGSCEDVGNGMSVTATCGPPPG